MDDSATLGEARAYIAEHKDDGVTCPACDQFAKTYWRRISSTLARALITLHRHGGATQFIHTSVLPGDTHEMSQASWWGLVVDEGGTRADGGRRGHWKLTALGEAFVNRETTIPTFAVIYNGECTQLTGPPTGISSCLGKSFNYTELMEGK